MKMMRIEEISKDLLKVGALAARAGVGAQTIHYYERIGLLPQAQRSAANYRLYPLAILRRVQFIKKGQALGFTLDELKEILDLHDYGKAPCRRVVEIGGKHLREIDARIAALKEFRQALATVVPRWRKETASTRRCAGEFCDLVEKLPLAGRAQKKIKIILDTLVK